MKQNLCHRGKMDTCILQDSSWHLSLQLQAECLPLEDTEVLLCSCIQIPKTLRERVGYKSWLKPKTLGMKNQHNQYQCYFW